MLHPRLDDRSDDAEKRSRRWDVPGDRSFLFGEQSKTLARRRRRRRSITSEVVRHAATIEKPSAYTRSWVDARALLHVVDDGPGETQVVHGARLGATRTDVPRRVEAVGPGDDEALFVQSLVARGSRLARASCRRARASRSPTVSRSCRVALGHVQDEHPRDATDLHLLVVSPRQAAVAGQLTGRHCRRRKMSCSVGR